jgi:hypothetical protein
LAPSLHLSGHSKHKEAQKEGKTMKTTTTRIMIATALMVLATGVASAQVLKADIPFAFRAGSKLMAPGTYTVRVAGRQHNMVILSNYASRESAIVLPSGPTAAPKEWTNSGDPILAFECAASRCALSQIYTGFSDPVLTVPHAKTVGGEQASLTLIHLSKANGD